MYSRHATSPLASPAAALQPSPCSHLTGETLAEADAGTRTAFTRREWQGRGDTGTRLAHGIAARVRRRHGGCRRTLLFSTTVRTALLFPSW